MNSIGGVCARPLRPIHDERRYLMEVLRSDWPEFERFGQASVTIGYPRVAKGWRNIKRQTDHFVIVRGFKAVGHEPVYVMDFSTEFCNYQPPDEFRIPYDTKEIWHSWTVKMG